MPDTLNPTEITEEQLDQQINDLSQKQDITDDEKQELADLKEDKRTRFQKRIDTLKSEKKLSDYKYEQASQEINNLKEEINNLRETVQTAPKVPLSTSQETVKIGNSSFFTDRALQIKIQSGEMTEAEAYTHQQERIEEAAADKAYKRLKFEQQATQEQTTRQQDAQKVLQEYPHFDKHNPNFNPDDPLYKEATRLWEIGFKGNPRGLSLAIAEAKKILRMSDTKPDLSNELNVRSPSAPSSQDKGKVTTLSDDERDIAEKMYCRGDITNPKTGRAYTAAEAHEKFKNAKASRPSRRIT